MGCTLPGQTTPLASALTQATLVRFDAAANDWVPVGEQSREAWLQRWVPPPLPWPRPSPQPASPAPPPRWPQAHQDSPQPPWPTHPSPSAPMARRQWHSRTQPPAGGRLSCGTMRPLAPGCPWAAWACLQVRAVSATSVGGTLARSAVGEAQPRHRCATPPAASRLGCLPTAALPPAPCPTQAKQSFPAWLPAAMATSTWLMKRRQPPAAAPRCSATAWTEQVGSRWEGGGGGSGRCGGGSGLRSGAWRLHAAVQK